MSPNQLELLQLGLEGAAWDAAREFSTAQPSAEIISGKRTLEEQAHAMAETIVAGALEWLGVYLYAPIRVACQTWMSEHQSVIAAGILSVLRSFTEEQLEHFSVHLTGMAFDVRPVAGARGKMMLRDLRAIVEKHGGTLLEKEGGRTIWHAQFKKK